MKLHTRNQQSHISVKHGEIMIYPITVIDKLINCFRLQHID